MLTRKIKDLSAKSNALRVQVNSYKELVYALVTPSPTSVKCVVLSAKRPPLN